LATGQSTRTWFAPPRPSSSGLIGASEDIDSAADAVEPELARVEFDDAAMAEAWTEHQQGHDEWAADTDEDPEDR
jgi:hypothetical protein